MISIALKAGTSMPLNLLCLKCHSGAIEIDRSGVLLRRYRARGPVLGTFSLRFANSAFE